MGIDDLPGKAVPSHTHQQLPHAKVLLLTLDIFPPLSSFGDPNAHPPTPQQTPSSAVFPSPGFQTPRAKQGSFSESGGWTPKFAEDYSVFNTTPGNLRGSNGPFLDFAPITPGPDLAGHKRLLSAESVAAEIATHATHFSPDPNAPLPPLDPAARLPSTPRHSQFSIDTAVFSDSKKKGAYDSQDISVPDARPTKTTVQHSTQTATPPPSSSKKGRKLAPKLNMQDEHGYSQPDFSGMPPQQDMTVFIGSGNDMFGYPMSAPVTAPANFWDPAAMGMDLDFSMPDTTLFQQPSQPGHRSMGSFDWSHEPQLFQEPSASSAATVLPENALPPKKERPLAPKPVVSDQMSGAMTDSFDVMHTGDGVDPGLLFGRTQTSTTDHNSEALPNGTFGANGQNSSFAGGSLRKKETKSVRAGNLPDRAFASSPVKSTARPGLSRSFSENRGKKTMGRGALPGLNTSRTSGPNNTASVGKTAGRTSPFKHQKRLSALASIPESSPHSRPRASVKFTIDAHGRARAESTLLTDPSQLSSSRASRGFGHDSQGSDDDSSETDDEPIIIPSRNTSFSASFALPDPLKPVGSIFHSSRRSISDRSTSTTTTLESQHASHNDEESEAETVMNGPQDGGDAASELRKVLEGRQRRSLQAGGRFGSTGSLSPTPQNRPHWPSEGRGVRCVCNRDRADESDGFMMQW